MFEEDVMADDHLLFQNAGKFATHLRRLRRVRRKRKLAVRSQGGKRQSLNVRGRRNVLDKTGKRCHICGGKIDGAWEADHVFAHAQGGDHSVDNFLPAHKICNNYRWFYGPEEFQWILKLGVWLRTKIENEDQFAMELAEKFVRDERRRDSRRKKPHSPGKISS